ncbi:MAG TPA: hypothetical protein VF189_00480 [Patescibacteria group bacterium]
MENKYNSLYLSRNDYSKLKGEYKNQAYLDSALYDGFSKLNSERRNNLTIKNIIGVGLALSFFGKIASLLAVRS